MQCRIAVKITARAGQGYPAQREGVALCLHPCEQVRGYVLARRSGEETFEQSQVRREPEQLAGSATGMASLHRFNPAFMVAEPSEQDGKRTRSSDEAPCAPLDDEPLPEYQGQAGDRRHCAWLYRSLPHRSPEADLEE